MGKSLSKSKRSGSIPEKSSYPADKETRLSFNVTPKRENQLKKSEKSKIFWETVKT